jgi:hypothetical protein
MVEVASFFNAGSGYRVQQSPAEKSITGSRIETWATQRVRCSSCYFTV